MSPRRRRLAALRSADTPRGAGTTFVYGDKNPSTGAPGANAEERLYAVERPVGVAARTARTARRKCGSATDSARAR
eukprot:364909-Chlamydomonas_euryale.AAC.4